MLPLGSLLWHPWGPARPCQGFSCAHREPVCLSKPPASLDASGFQPQGVAGCTQSSHWLLKPGMYLVSQPPPPLRKWGEDSFVPASGNRSTGVRFCTLEESSQNRSLGSQFLFWKDCFLFNCKISFPSLVSCSAQEAKLLKVQEARRDLHKVVLSLLTRRNILSEMEPYATYILSEYGNPPVSSSYHNFI